MLLKEYVRVAQHIQLNKQIVLNTDVSMTDTYSRLYSVRQLIAENGLVNKTIKYTVAIYLVDGNRPRHLTWIDL